MPPDHPPPLSDARLDELEAMEAKATAGPWYARATDDSHHMNARMVSTIPGPIPGEFTHDNTPRNRFDDCGCVALTLHQLTPEVGLPDGLEDENTEFIAALRNDARSLIQSARDAAVLREAMEAIATPDPVVESNPTARRLRDEARAALEQIKRTAAGGKGEGT